MLIEAHAPGSHQPQHTCRWFPEPDAAALVYLRASLHGAILDTLRTSSRPKEIPLPLPGEAGEPSVEDQTDGSELCEILQTVLPNRREQRLAYLLYHCGLKPREIVHFCPQEWSDVQEIYHLRRTSWSEYCAMRTNFVGGSIMENCCEEGGESTALTLHWSYATASLVLPPVL
jgi:hypothetical protein